VRIWAGCHVSLAGAAYTAKYLVSAKVLSLYSILARPLHNRKLHMNQHMAFHSYAREHTHTNTCTHTHLSVRPGMIVLFV
jgi:hypothetical protein